MSTTTKKPTKTSTTKTTSATSKSSAAKVSTTKTSPPKTPVKTTTAKAPISALDGKAPIAAKTATPTLVEGQQSVILGPVMRKKELIDTVVTRSGMKKKDAKPIVDAMLDVLGEALADNRELILPPLGRVKVRKEKKLPNGRVLVVKVRQTTAPKSDDTV